MFRIEPDGFQITCPGCFPVALRFEPESPGAERSRIGGRQPISLRQIVEDAPLQSAPARVVRTLKLGDGSECKFAPGPGIVGVPLDPGFQDAEFSPYWELDILAEEILEVFVLRTLPHPLGRA